MSHEIRLEQLSRRDTAQVHFRASEQELPGKFGQVFGEVGSYLGRNGIPFEGPAFASFVRDGDQFEVNAGFLVPGPIPGDGHVVAGELPACEALVTLHIGPYDSAVEAYDDLHAWAREHGRELAEPMWEYYMSDPATPPAEVRTEVFWPLK